MNGELPLPNDQFGINETVIASTWITDTGGEDQDLTIGMIMTISDKRPYYHIHELVLLNDVDDDWNPKRQGFIGTYSNIVEATNEWQEYGGDI